MNMFSLLTSICLLVLASRARGKAYPSDITGTFIDYDGKNPSTCPTQIKQTTFTQSTVEGSWQFEHNTALHGESRCDSHESDRLTIFYNDTLVPDNVPEGLNEVLNNHGVNLEVDYPLNHRAVTAGETYYIGYETSGRYCQDGSKFDAGTVYFLFRPFLPVNMPLRSNYYTFQPEWKYLIVVPNYSEEYCIYKAFVPGAASDPAMQNMTSASLEEEPELSLAPDMESTPDLNDNTVEPVSVPVVNEISENSSSSTETESEDSKTSDFPFENTSDIAVETPVIIPLQDDSVSLAPLEGMAEETMEAELEENSRACFPGNAKVELKDGSLKLMSELKIGDMVRTGLETFSEIFMFTHRTSNVQSSFIRIETEKSNVLLLSPSHFLPLNGELAPAMKACVGDYVKTSQGLDTIISIRTSREDGLYNPQTLDGNIIVNDIYASTYTKAVEPKMAQALLLPLRSIFSLIGRSTSILDNGLEGFGFTSRRG